MHEREAIILEKRPYREADEMITCLSPQEGKISVRARGVRKSGAKLAGSLRILNHVLLYTVDAQILPIVTDVTVVESFPRVRSVAETADASSVIAAFCARVLPEGAHDMVSWWQLTDVLHALERGEAGSASVAHLPTFFSYTLMRLSGLMPEMQQCVLCGYAITEEETCRFSVKEGGVLHLNCRSSHRSLRGDVDTVSISSAARAQLRQWNTMDTKGFLRSTVAPPIGKELETLVDQLVQWHLDASMHAPLWG